VDGIAWIRTGWILSHGWWSSGEKDRLENRTAQVGSDSLKAPYFFYSNEGVKDKLASLRQPEATPAWEVPRDVSADYKKQMIAEHKKDVVNATTKQVQQRWVKIGGRPNHFWDCECIALASAMLAGVLPTGEAA